MDQSCGSRMTDFIHFSFVDYEFSTVWCAHQNAVIEEETYLHIKNNGVEPVSVRCLLKRNPNFRVELSSVNYEVVSVQLGAAKRQVYMIGPKDTITFRVVFSPKEEKLHKCTIDFMLEEIEGFGVRQGCRKHAPPDRREQAESVRFPQC